MSHINQIATFFFFLLKGALNIGIGFGQTYHISVNYYLNKINLTK